jgi:hypothetical protein
LGVETVGFNTRVLFKKKIKLDSTFYFFNFGLPILFLGLAFLMMPISQVFWFDTDEGQELIKAVLYAQGYSLYEPIWSDQPPLLTIILAQWFALWGQSVVAARVLILGFATLLIWAFANIIRVSLGRVQAVLAVFMLAISCNFLRLSVSVMIGMPCLALAMISLYFLVLFQKSKRNYYLIISGIAFALSLQIKMFSIFLLPFWGLLILEANWRDRESVSIQGLLFKTGLWLGAIAAIFLGFSLAFHSLQLNAFFQFHLTANLQDVFVRENSLIDVALMYLQELDYTLLALLGLVAVWQTPGWLAKIPVLWLGSATAMLIRHKPVWYHHYLLLSIPLTWLAVYGISLAFPFFKSKAWYERIHFKTGKSVILIKIAAGLCVLAAIATPVKLAVLHWQNQTFIRDSQAKGEIIARIEQYQAATNWLFTDNPGYAFYTGLNVPPEIAVLSRKRVASGTMTPEYLQSLLDRYDPEQILLERFPEVRGAIQPNLQLNYHKIYEVDSTTHYLLNSLNF